VREESGKNHGMCRWGKLVLSQHLLMQLFCHFGARIAIIIIVLGKKFPLTVFRCRKKLPGKVREFVLSGKWQQ